MCEAQYLVPDRLPYQLIQVAGDVSEVRVVYELGAAAAVLDQTSEHFDTKWKKVNKVIIIAGVTGSLVTAPHCRWSGS